MTEKHVFDEGLEKSLLGALLTYGTNAVIKLPDLRSEHFFFDEHKAVFGAITHCLKQSNHISVLSVKNRLDSMGFDLGQHLGNLAVAGAMIVNIKPYAEKIMALALRRNIKAACDRIAHDCLNNFDAAEEDLLNDMHSQSLALSKDISGSRFKTDREVDYEICDDMSKSFVAYPTQLHSLDRVMVGGLHAGRSYCIAAAPKAGKSAMLATISENLARQKIKHLYIVLEMGAKELRMRILSRRMGVNSLSFYQKDKSVDFIDNAAGHMVESHGDVIILDEANLHFEEMQKLITLAVINYGIKGFILDYVQLVLGCKPRDNKAYFIESVCQWIAGFCKRENIFGLYAAQLNSSGEVRGSQGALQAADQVYYLHGYDDKDEMRKSHRWLQMRASRYTALSNIGSEFTGGLKLNPYGNHFEEM